MPRRPVHLHPRCGGRRWYTTEGRCASIHFSLHYSPTYTFLCTPLFTIHCTPTAPVASLLQIPRRPRMVPIVRMDRAHTREELGLWGYGREVSVGMPLERCCRSLAQSHSSNTTTIVRRRCTAADSRSTRRGKWRASSPTWCAPLPRSTGLC